MKNGIIKSKDGYILEKTDGHDGRRYIQQHRRVAEEMLGRKLLKGEVVHHKNGIKTDNRPENLAVMTNIEHLRLHAELKKGKPMAKAETYLNNTKSNASIDRDSVIGAILLKLFELSDVEMLVAQGFIDGFAARGEMEESKEAITA